VARVIDSVLTCAPTIGLKNGELLVGGFEDKGLICVSFPFVLHGIQHLFRDHSGRANPAHAQTRAEGSSCSELQCLLYSLGFSRGADRFEHSAWMLKMIWIYHHSTR
jgi:hypothetical protein